MLRSMLISAVLIAPHCLAAAEKVSITNFYVVNQEQIPAGEDVFWKEDNYGTYTVEEGPIDPGFVRCVGSGFGEPSGVSGGGVCVYGEEADTFTMRWEVVSFGVNNWRIVSSTGKYSGMTGSGTTKRTYVGNQGDVTFNSTLNISNNASATNSEIYLNHGSNSANSYNDNIVIESTHSSSDGIKFGESQGTGTLANTKTITVGTSGFIAGHCILDLLEHGYEVRGTVRNLDKAPALKAMFAKYTDKADSIEFAQADLTNEDGWLEAAQGCDGLFHLASPVPLQQPKNADELIRPAREGALNALKAANAAGIKRAVLTSSIAAVMFGHKEKHRTFNESDWTNVDATGVAYYKSKALAEQAAWDYVKDTDIQLSTVLPGFVLGPALESDYGTSLQLIVELLKGKYPVVPKIGFEAVDVRDIASLHRLAYEKPEAVGKRFIGANGWVMFKEVAQILKQAYPDKKVSTVELPELLSNILSYPIKDMDMVKGEGGKTKKADNSAAMSLGWAPHTVEEAILSGAESLVNLGVVKGK